MQWDHNGFCCKIRTGKKQIKNKLSPATRILEIHVVNYRSEMSDRMITGIMNRNISIIIITKLS